MKIQIGKASIDNAINIVFKENGKSMVMLLCMNEIKTTNSSGKEISAGFWSEEVDIEKIIEECKVKANKDEDIHI